MLNALNSLVGNQVRVIDANLNVYYGKLGKSGDMFVTKNSRNFPVFFLRDVNEVNTLERTIYLNWATKR